MEVTKHEPGMFSWADLASTEEKGSRRFYTELLELNATAFPIGGGAEYFVLSKNGKSVCAMYEMNQDMRQQTGGHPFWNTYFTVESADDVAAEVKRRGGARAQGALRRDGRGPDGRGAGTLQGRSSPCGSPRAGSEPSSSASREPLAWSELYTHDTEAASSFYAGLFGWSMNRTAWRVQRRVLRVSISTAVSAAGHDGHQEGVG